MSQTPRPAEVFVGYYTPDTPIAEDLAAALRDKGIEVFYFNLDVECGDGYIERQGEALKNAKYYIPLLSQASIVSTRWFKWELEAGLCRAVNGELTILPVCIDISAREMPIFLTPRDAESWNHADCVPNLISRILGTGRKPPIGELPMIIREFVKESGLSVAEEVIVKHLVQLPAEYGDGTDIILTEDSVQELGLTPREAAIGLKKLTDMGYLRRYDFIGKQEFQPTLELYRQFDGLFADYDPALDARVLASILHNEHQHDNGVMVDELASRLQWSVRRMNSALLELHSHDGFEDYGGAGHFPWYRSYIYHTTGTEIFLDESV